MSAVTTVTGWNVEGGDETRVHTEDVPDVHMSLAGEARTNGDEYDGAEWRCSVCNTPLYEDGTDVETGGDVCEDAPGAMTHDRTPIPFSWANSASIRASEGQDTITVAISVGDPRGAFMMSVERIRFTDEEGNERDELRLSVPTPEDGFPHMSLTPLASPGYYRIS